MNTIYAAPFLTVATYTGLVLAVIGGLGYVVLAMAAGLGYAIFYQRTRSIEMSMLAHFGLNTTHFPLFTYPRVPR